MEVIMSKNILKFGVITSLLFVNTVIAYAGNFLGTRVISDGATYNLNVGDTITFRNARQPRSSQYYAFNWFISDQSLADFKGIGANSPHLRVTAKEAGEFTVTATLDYSEQFGLYDFRSYNYEDKFTVIISD